MAVWKSVGDQLTWKAELDMCIPLCVLCPLMIGLMVVWLKGFFGIVSMVLVLWEVAAILGNACGIKRQNYVALLQGSEMSAGFHYRNFILCISCFRLIASNTTQWSNG